MFTYFKLIRVDDIYLNLIFSTSSFLWLWTFAQIYEDETGDVYYSLNTDTCVIKLYGNGKTGGYTGLAGTRSPLPSTIYEIKQTAFINCPITKITLNNDYCVSMMRSIDYDGKYYFNLDNLQTLILGVTNIIDKAFRDCTKLTYIKYLGTKDPSIYSNVFSGWDNIETVEVPYNYQSSYFSS